MTDNEKNSATEMTDNEKLTISVNGVEIKKLAEYALKTLELFEARNIVAQQQKTIDRQKEQIESLISGQETLQKALNEKIEEVESLKRRLHNSQLHQKETHKALQDERLLRLKEEFIKSEAVKECLDKIEQMDVSESDNYIMVKKNEFNNLVKEMVGE